MMAEAHSEFLENTINWLSAMIQIPSFSKEEELTAQWLFDLLEKYGAGPSRYGNNIWQNLLFGTTKNQPS